MRFAAPHSAASGGAARVPRTVIALKPNRLCGVLGGVAVALVGTGTVLNAVKFVTGDRELYGLMSLFKLSEEGNLPAFFSGCLLLLNAVLLAFVCRVRRDHSRPSLIWGFLSAIFAFLAYDELFSVHERLIEPLRTSLGASGMLHFTWIVAYGAGLVVLSAVFFPEWRGLDGSVKRWMALSALIYLAGAVGFEMLGGARYASAGGGDALYGILYTIEETLEMAGLIVFAHTVLRLLRVEFGEVALTLDAS